MTHQDAGSYAAKRPPGETADPKIADAVRARAVENELPCGGAEKVAGDLRVEMASVGATLDILGIRISRCQLGLFGYEPAGRTVKAVPAVAPVLADAVRRALVNDRLPCASAWAIAQSLAIPRMDVANACETLKIKVKPCQLGAF